MTIGSLELICDFIPMPSLSKGTSRFIEIKFIIMLLVSLMEVVLVSSRGDECYSNSGC